MIRQAPAYLQEVDSCRVCIYELNVVPTVRIMQLELPTGSPRNQQVKAPQECAGCEQGPVIPQGLSQPEPAPDKPPGG